MAQLTQQEQALLASVDTGLHIAGTWRETRDQLRTTVHDPATGLVLTTVASAGAEDALDALDAAAKAQDDWAATAPRHRAELLRAAYEQVVTRADDLALLITLEMGKPLEQSHGEVRYGAEFFRWFSEETPRISGSWMRSPEGTARLITMQHPVGPTLMITPWNFPLAMAARKIAPAIAAGCTMILKPAPQTPLTALVLSQILHEVGVPAGVLNVIPSGRAPIAVAPLFEDGRLRKLTFTGSTNTGQALARRAAHGPMRVSLELGGNAPFIVCEDADLDAAVDGAMLAKMRNMGQACTAANRFLVHREVVEEFSSHLTDRMATQTVGRGTEPTSTVGPLIDDRQRASVHRLVEDALGEGASVGTGGHALATVGYFYAPTVLYDVAPTSAINTTEIFGPVAPITTYSTDYEALTMANSTEYGLAAYVYTRDLGRGMSLCERLEAGMVGLNQGLISNPAAPFGGIKASGYGREGGAEGIHEYLATKYVGTPS